MENYTYAALIDRSDPDSLIATFPDFDDRATCGTQEDIIEMAQDWLALNIIDKLESGEALPVCAFHKPPDDPNLALIYVNVWLPYHRSKARETYVKKTLTLPVWLDILAKNSNISFSRALVRGLKEELGISGSA